MITKKEEFIEQFLKILPEHTNKLPNQVVSKIDSINSNSWFKINKYSVNEPSINNLQYKNKLPKVVINCQKVKMLLNQDQKKIIDKWMEANTIMYNNAVKYIRNECNICYTYIIKDKLKHIYKYSNFQTIRNNLKNIKKNILNNSQIKEIQKNTCIPPHTLDYSIRQLCSNIKSAITNLQRKHIKRFRIKYWNHNRPSKIIEIEKSAVSKKNNHICFNILGIINYEYNKKPFILPKIVSNVKINYNSILDEYTLLIPIKNKTAEITREIKPNNIIVLDPGLRTFMTGLSENNAYSIGEKVNKKISYKLSRLNNIKKNENIPLKIKKKNEKIINRKIFNQIDDMHWKTIKFLTTNFQNILLGDMSAKSIVRKNNSILSPVAKTACLRTRYYNFYQRLEYKCKLTKTNFRLVNEYYTSKTCSNCGNYNEDLKGEKYYCCKKCNFGIHRDVNACRNIMIKSLI